MTKSLRILLWVGISILGELIFLFYKYVHGSLDVHSDVISLLPVAHIGLGVLQLELTYRYRVLLWLQISALGAGAVAYSALQKGETINALWLVIAGVCSFAVAYRFYSKWLIT
ncbi:MAG: hypothetical protein NTY98_26870, partial [Verrucomicrobia bacterium]|nr:hypothetical protein [Verrucomicrobiota bacterium]